MYNIYIYIYIHIFERNTQASFEDLKFLDVEVEVVDLGVGQVGEEGWKLWKDNVTTMTSNLDLD